MRYVDPDGKVIETGWDVFNVALDASSFVSNMVSGNYSGAAWDLFLLLYDSAATVIPGLPGGTGSAKLVSKLTAEYGDEAASLVLNYSDDMAEIVFKGGNSKKLANNLIKNGIERGENQAAHHIVAGGSKYAKDTRKILARFNISVNDAANGVFLDKSMHSKLHTKEYYQKVYDILEGSNSKEDILNRLEYISNILSSGGTL